MADNEVARAVLTIVPSMEGAQQEITSQLTSAASSPGVAKAGDTAGSTFSGGLKKGMAVAGVATAAVGAAAAKAADSFISAAGDVAAYGDNIDKMSQKMGISAEAYQEWDFVAQHSGTSMESLKTSFKTLSNAAQDGKEEFEALGISLEDAASMSTEDLFSAVITGLQGMEEGTERTAIASSLLGKGATELGALLNTSAEDTEAMKQQLHDLGGVMSDDAVKGAAAYQDSLQNMQTSFSGLLNGMMSEFLPGITSVMDGITAIVSGDSEGGLGMISEGIQAIITNLSESAPQLFEIAGSILSSFAQAVIDNAPLIFDAAVPIIMNLVQGIISNLPAIFSTALEILMTIVNGISENLPTLIPAAIEAIITIVTGLIENIDLLIDAALQLIIGLATGLIEALPILIEKAPEIILALYDALVAAVPKILEAGIKLITTLVEGISTTAHKLYEMAPELINTLKERFDERIESLKSIGRNIVEGIKKGISDAWGAVTDWFGEKIGDLVGSVKDFLGIESPSKVFANEVGQWIPKGIAVGVEANADDLYKSVDDVVAEAIITPNMTSLNAASGLNGGMITNAMTGSTELFNLLSQYLPQIASGENINITLEGDAGRLFRMMQTESLRNKQITGQTSFA